MLIDGDQTYIFGYRFTPPLPSTLVPSEDRINETVALTGGKNKIKLLPNNLDLRSYSILPAFQGVCSLVRLGSSARSKRNRRPNFSVASGYVRDKIILLAERLVVRAMMQGHLLNLVVLQMSGGCLSFKNKASLRKKLLAVKEKWILWNIIRTGTVYLKMKPLATMRIRDSLNCDLCTQGSSECHALDHIQSELQSVDLHDAVLLAIPLGNSQFDLAVEQTAVRQIGKHFIDLSSSRLLSYDPLFVAEFGRSFPETAFDVLTQMRGQYNLAASSVYKSKDSRRIHWFETQTKRIENLLETYRQQCFNLAPIPIHDKQRKTVNKHNLSRSHDHMYEGSQRQLEGGELGHNPVEPI